MRQWWLWLVLSLAVVTGCGSSGDTPDNPKTNGDIVWVDADELGIVPCLRFQSANSFGMSCDWAHARRVPK
jgi:hypothetical protein